jgi:hypothetical protein
VHAAAGGGEHPAFGQVDQARVECDGLRIGGRRTGWPLDDATPFEQPLPIRRGAGTHRGRRGVELAAHRLGERLRRFVAHRERDIEHDRIVMRQQLAGTLQAAPRHVARHRGAEMGAEQTVKVVRRDCCLARQRLVVQRFGEVLADMGHRTCEQLEVAQRCDLGECLSVRHATHCGDGCSGPRVRPC